MKTTGSKNDLIKSLLDLKDGIYDLQVEPHKEGRSLNANSYYWQLVGQYAKWAGKSTQYIHNDMIAHYGQPEMISGEAVEIDLPDTDEWREAMTYHLCPTWMSYHGGRRYILMRPSHTYDTAEFSRLVDGLVQTIQGSGAPIETMTPDEMERLKGYER